MPFVAPVLQAVGLHSPCECSACFASSCTSIFSQTASVCILACRHQADSIMHHWVLGYLHRYLDALQEKAKASEAAAAKAQAAVKEPAQPTPALDSKAKPSDAGPTHASPTQNGQAKGASKAGKAGKQPAESAPAADEASPASAPATPAQPSEAAAQGKVRSQAWLSLSPVLCVPWLTLLGPAGLCSEDLQRPHTCLPCSCMLAAPTGASCGSQQEPSASLSDVRMSVQPAGIQSGSVAHGAPTFLT